MIAALLLAAADPPGAWASIGVTDSRLRVFIERASLRVDGDQRFARIRIGSPTSMAGAIVLGYPDEAIDCRARTWRLVAFDARDADDHIVKQGRATAAAIPVVAGTIGDAVVRAGCGLPAPS